MEFFVNIICWIARHKFLFLGIAIPLFVLLTILKSKRKNINPVAVLISLIIFIYAIVNIVWGNDIANSLIFKYGEEGKGIVVSVKETSSTFNEQRVLLYEVILTTKDNKIIETSFESWDFNIYPKPKGAYSYPQPGIEFSTRYLKSNPDAFIILSNDNSTYAIQKKCQKTLNDLNIAKLKFNASPSSTNYKNAYINAIKNYINLGCEENNFLLDHYKKELEKLESN